MYRCSKSAGTLSTVATPRRFGPSQTPSGRATPAGQFGVADPLGQRRLHDVEQMLGDSNLKVDRLTSKLTESHQEVQRLRAQLEARDKDLAYQTRLAERVKKEQAHVQADADAHKDMVRRLEARLSSKSVAVPGGGDHNTAVLAERVQRLTTRLQAEQEGARTQRREVVRLQDELVVTREALDARGELGALQREVVQARSDGLQLALQLQEAKEVAAQAEEARAASDAQAAAHGAAAEQLRGALAEASERGEQLQAELARSQTAAAKLQTEGRKLAADNQGLRAEAQQAAEREREQAAQNQQLRQALAEQQGEVAALRSEMAQREEEFQVELNLFTERHDELSAAARRAEAEARAETARADQMQAAAHGQQERGGELMTEVGNLNASLDALTEQNAQLQRDYAQLSQRYQQQGSDLSKAAASLAVTQETGDARHAMLAGRLEAALRELQALPPHPPPRTPHAPRAAPRAPRGPHKQPPPPTVHGS